MLNLQKSVLLTVFHSLLSDEIMDILTAVVSSAVMKDWWTLTFETLDEPLFLHTNNMFLNMVIFEAKGGGNFAM